MSFLLKIYNALKIIKYYIRKKVAYLYVELPRGERKLNPRMIGVSLNKIRFCFYGTFAISAVIMRSLWIFFYTKGAQNVMILSRNDFSSNSFHTISVENKSSITSIKERAFDFYSLDNSSRNSKSNTTLLFQDIRAFFLQSNNKSDVAVPGQKIEHSVVTPLLRKRRKYRRDGRKKVSSALSILEQTDSNVERVVGFFNMFERDGVVFSRIVNEQVGSIDASGLLNKIAYISYVYFGQNYLSLRTRRNMSSRPHRMLLETRLTHFSSFMNIVFSIRRIRCFICTPRARTIREIQTSASGGT